MKVSVLGWALQNGVLLDFAQVKSRDSMVALRLPWNDNVEERKPQKKPPLRVALIGGLVRLSYAFL